MQVSHRILAHENRDRRAEIQALLCLQLLDRGRVMPISYAIAIFSNIDTPEECLEVSVEEKMQAVEILTGLKMYDIKKFVPKTAIFNALKFVHGQWRKYEVKNQT